MKLRAKKAISKSLLAARAVPPPSDWNSLSQGLGLSHQTGASCFNSVVPEVSASRVCSANPLAHLTWMPMDH